MHARVLLVVLQRDVRHDVAGRGPGGHGDMPHPLPLRARPLLVKLDHAHEGLPELIRARMQFLLLPFVHRGAAVKYDGFDAMLHDGHDEAICFVFGGQHGHEWVDIRRTIWKVYRRRTADERAIRVRTGVVVADLRLLFLLDASAALDLALLKFDGGSVEPDGDIGGVVALGGERDLVGRDALAGVETMRRGRPRSGVRLVIVE